MYCIVYKKGEKDLSAYSDSDHAGETADRCSTSGIMIEYGRGPIIFSSRKQNTVAQSSTEAEYIAANEAVKGIVWVSQLYKELKIQFNTPVLHIDNEWMDHQGWHLWKAEPGSKRPPIQSPFTRLLSLPALVKSFFSLVCLYCFDLFHVFILRRCNCANPVFGC